MKLRLVQRRLLKVLTSTLDVQSVQAMRLQTVHRSQRALLVGASARRARVGTRRPWLGFGARGSGSGSDLGLD